MATCTGDHDIYVADVVGIPSQGKVVVITVCRMCDMVHFHEHNVGPSAGFQLKSEKEK